MQGQQQYVSGLTKAPSDLPSSFPGVHIITSLVQLAKEHQRLFLFHAVVMIRMIFESNLYEVKKETKVMLLLFTLALDFYQ